MLTHKYIVQTEVNAILNDLQLFFRNFQTQESICSTHMHDYVIDISPIYNMQYNIWPSHRQWSSMSYHECLSLSLKKNRVLSFNINWKSCKQHSSTTIYTFRTFVCDRWNVFSCKVLLIGEGRHKTLQWQMLQMNISKPSSSNLKTAAEIHTVFKILIVWPELKDSIWQP